MLSNVYTYRMNGDVYSKIDGQQAENIVLQQNTAYWSQMKLQPNVSYVAPTVNNNKYVIIILLIFNTISIHNFCVYS